MQDTQLTPALSIAGLLTLWVVAAVLPVVLETPARAGLGLVAAVFAVGLVNYLLGIRGTRHAI